MAIKFKVTELVNRLNKKSPKIAFATKVPSARVGIPELSEIISERSTVSRADVKAVLDSLSWASAHYIALGMNVSLGDLGSLSVRIRSKATATAQEFSEKNIKTPRVLFHPGRELREQLASLSFLSIQEEGLANPSKKGKEKHPAFETEPSPSAPVPPKKKEREEEE